MRNPLPLIVGAGPAGCAAAIGLGRAGVRSVLLDRDEVVGDALCGGFLSWHTVRQLRELGIDPARLGGHRVGTLAIIAKGRESTIALPAPAYGLSRHALDTALRRTALAAGAQLAIDTIRQIGGTTAFGQRQEWRGSGMFLATGKHDVRGARRPRGANDPALGLRIRLPASPERDDLVGGRIELHLFEGGYAGINLQEGGAANICLALRKSVLAEAGGQPQALLAILADRQPLLARRLGTDWRSAQIDTIGAVPYGYIARPGPSSQFRLGDQAAVIPSLAGEGMGIAVASGTAAAQCWLANGPDSARTFQRNFARQARTPVRLASLAWAFAETGPGQSIALAAARHIPAAYTGLMTATRVQDPALPCADASPC